MSTSSAVRDLAIGDKVIVRGSIPQEIVRIESVGEDAFRLHMHTGARIVRSGWNALETVSTNR